MKIRIKQVVAITASVLSFALASCDESRNKAQLHGSEDTLATESAKNNDSTNTQTNADSTDVNKGTDDGNADPSGRVKNQNER